GPITIQVKKIVVVASTGPVFIMLCGEAVAAWFRTLSGPIELNIALAPVRIFKWIDDDHRVIEPLFDPWIFAGGQLVCNLHRSLRAVRFIAMNVVAQPDHDWH